jgi:hypothetical protein
MNGGARKARGAGVLTTTVDSRQLRGATICVRGVLVMRWLISSRSLGEVKVGVEVGNASREGDSAYFPIYCADS